MKVVYRRKREKKGREKNKGTRNEGAADLDLSGLADDAGQSVELIHKGLELVHRQFGAVAAALRTQTAAADTHGKNIDNLNLSRESIDSQMETKKANCFFIELH